MKQANPLQIAPLAQPWDGFLVGPENRLAHASVLALARGESAGISPLVLHADVPLYNGIHFVLNGIRGLVLPWVGSILFILVGPLAVLAATLVSLSSIPIIVRSLKVQEQGKEPGIRVFEAADTAPPAKGTLAS